MDLTGKVFVITGASKGLGKELAHALKSEGAHVFLTARTKSILEETARELDAPFLVGSVSNEKDMQEVANRAFSTFGRLDGWINNAGGWSPVVPLDQFDATRAHELIDTNLFGTVFGSRAAISVMKKNTGVIVNILSTTALDGKSKSMIFGADKWGASNFTRILREEFRDKNIKVIGIYPGGMQTDVFAGKNPSEYSAFLTPHVVAQKIVENLKKESPEDELILRRPSS